MANSITRATSSEVYYGMGDLVTITIEGYKYSGTAATGSTANILKCTALSGSVEENVKVTGTQGTVTPNWAATTAYDYGDMVNSVVGSTTYWHLCVNNGTSGATEPTWHGSENGQTTEGTGGLRWKNINKSCRFHNGTSYRNALVDTGQDFRTDISQQMVTVNTTTNLIESTSDRGCFNKSMCWDNGDIPSGNGYEVHGFEKDITEVTDYMQVYQGNLVRVTGGTGEGQVRRIQSVWDNGTEAEFIMETNFTTALDNTSTFIIEWSPMDIIYQSDAGGWGLGDLVFDDVGHRLILVRTKDFILEIGKANGTGDTTYFGFAGYVWNHRRPYYGGGVSSYGTPNGTKNAKARCDWGEANYGNSTSDEPLTAGFSAVIMGGAMGSWGSAFLSAGTGSESRLAKSIALIGGAGYGGKNTHGLLSTAGGEYWSFHNWLPGGHSNTYQSVGDYMTWSGGTWGGGMSLASSYNVTVNGLLGSPTPNYAAANDKGFGWNGQNTGTMSDFWTNLINANQGFVGVFQDATGRDCDYWTNDHDAWSGPYDWQIYFKKTVDITVIDAQSKAGISGVTCTIKDQNGTIISEADSGSVITADLTAATTTLTMDDTSPFTTGDLIRIDNEYITVGTVASGTSITGCTREARYPLIFFANLHKASNLAYSNKVYLVGSATSDSSGIIPQMTLYAYEMVSRDAAAGHEVTYGGINYQALDSHQATQANKPPNGSYWTAGGTSGFPWEENKYYSFPGTYGGSPGAGTSQSAQRSYNNHVPWSIVLSKPGYEQNISISNPSFDSTGVVKVVELVYEEFIEKKSG